MDHFQLRKCVKNSKFRGDSKHIFFNIVFFKTVHISSMYKNPQLVSRTEDQKSGNSGWVQSGMQFVQNALIFCVEINFKMPQACSSPALEVQRFFL